MFSLFSYQNTNLCSYQNVFISLTPSPTKIDPFDPVDPVAGSFPSQDLLLPPHLAQGFVGKVWSLAIMASWWNMLEIAGVCSSFTKLKYVFQHVSAIALGEVWRIHQPERRKKMESVLHFPPHLWWNSCECAVIGPPQGGSVFFWQNRLAGSSLNVWASLNANQTQSSAHGWIFDEAGPPELFATDLQRTLQIRNTHPQKDRKVKSHQNSDENHCSILFRAYYQVEHPPSCPLCFSAQKVCKRPSQGPQGPRACLQSAPSCSMSIRGTAMVAGSCRCGASGAVLWGLVGLVHWFSRHGSIHLKPVKTIKTLYKFIRIRKSTNKHSDLNIYK